MMCQYLQEVAEFVTHVFVSMNIYWCAERRGQCLQNVCLQQKVACLALQVLAMVDR